MHLAEIATQIAPAAHAALLVDQAGWRYFSGILIVPSNITLILLPAKCPELNPQENIWPFKRDNWLSNRVLQVRSTISSTIAATPGTSSSISPGKSCPLACAIGPTGRDRQSSGITPLPQLPRVAVTVPRPPSRHDNAAR